MTSDTVEITPFDPRPMCALVKGLRCGSLTPPAVKERNGRVTRTCRDPLCRTMTLASPPPSEKPRKRTEKSLTFNVKIMAQRTPRPPERCFGHFSRSSEWCDACENSPKCRERTLSVSSSGFIVEITRAGGDASRVKKEEV